MQQRRAIVLCQGEQYRLAELGYPKHLLPIGRETILGRTLRFLNNAGWPSVVVGTSKLAREAERHGSMLFTLGNPGFCVLDGIAQLGEFFADADVRIFLGDVVWSPSAFQSFLLGKGVPYFFAGNTSIGHETGELYGLGFEPRGRFWIEHLLRIAPCRMVAHDRGQPGHLRNLLFSASAAYELPPRKLYADDIYIPIDDWTRDIDKPEDLASIPSLVERIGVEG
jgi:hypothetical protein